MTVNGALDDGWGESFPLKGRELEAAVLIADISRFSARTSELDPTETLAFVNHFFAWTLAEGLRGRPGIIDRFNGDEVMIVFSKDFGSEAPFADAVQVGCGMGTNDAFAFNPHVGIATGRVIVGYVGTSAKYSVSVVGKPVSLAARCASAEPPEEAMSGWLTFPASDWGDRVVDETVPPGYWKNPDGSREQKEQNWTLSAPRSTEFKNMGEHLVRSLANRGIHIPSQSAEERAKEAAEAASANGFRWRRRT